MTRSPRPQQSEALRAEQPEPSPPAILRGMPEAPIFLIGGGWDAAAAPAVYGPFVQAAAAHGSGSIACLVLDFDEVSRYAELSHGAAVRRRGRRAHRGHLRGTS